MIRMLQLDGHDRPAEGMYLFGRIRRFAHWITAGAALAWLVAMVEVSGAEPAWIDKAFWLSAAFWLLFILACAFWFAAGMPDRFCDAQTKR